MGDCFVRFYRNNVKNSWKVAFVSAFAIGLLVHIYKFTNLLPIHDALFNVYSSQNMVRSGRWFLSIACGFSSYFDLPWINGLISVFFMALTAVVITEVFDMKNPCLILLSSGLLVSFPAMYATFGYEFTADGYMIAMFLSAISVYFTKMPANGIKAYTWRGLLSMLCICFSCGIYQAYVSFAFVLAVCYFIAELLENRREAKQYYLWIGIQVVVYVLALAAYYIIWKLCLYVQGFSATSYQGMNRIGLMNASSLLRAAYQAIRQFVYYLIEWNFLEYGLTKWAFLNILTCAAFVVGMAIALIRSGCLKRKLHLLLVILCVVSIPFGCFVLLFTSPAVNYHGLMLQSVCILFIFTAVICDRWCKAKFSTAVLILLTVVIFNNSVMANIYYGLLDQCLKKTQAVTAEVNTRIHLLDDGTIKYVAIVGDLDGYEVEDRYDPALLRELGGWRTVSRILMSEQYLYAYTDFNLSYYRQNNIPYPKVEFSSDNMPAAMDWEFRFPLLCEAQEKELIASEEVQKMPIWPHADSVKAIGDTIVIKLSEEA